MTAIELIFVNAVQDSVTEYCSKECTKVLVGSNQVNLLSKYREILLTAFTQMIVYYLRDTTTATDENFCTAVEAQEIVDHINNIMNTHHYTALS